MKAVIAFILGVLLGFLVAGGEPRETTPSISYLPCDDLYTVPYISKDDHLKEIRKQTQALREQNAILREQMEQQYAPRLYPGEE